MAANANPGSNVYIAYTGPNKYGSAPRDSSHEPINFTNAILTQDFTGRNATTPNAANDLVSPIALGATAGNATVLVVPPNATTITLTSTAAFNVSDYGTAGAALAQYYTQPANTPLTLNVARQQYLYISGAASQAVSFFFQTL